MDKTHPPQTGQVHAMKKIAYLWEKHVLRRIEIVGDLVAKKSIPLDTDVGLGGAHSKYLASKAIKKYNKGNNG